MSHFITNNSLCSVGRVGFERTLYSVTESTDPTVEVCLRVFDEQFEYSLFGNIVFKKTVLKVFIISVCMYNYVTHTTGKVYYDLFLSSKMLISIITNNYLNRTSISLL